MKRRFLSILLALCMIISILPMSALAADYEGHWSSEYIVKAKDRGWMNGYEDGTFRPNKSITRAEFSVMLWRALGSPAPQGCSPFTDVADDIWYGKAVTALYEADIVLGYGGGLFGPGGTLTREMAFTMLARAFGLEAEDEEAYAAFPDGWDTSTWARDAASALIEGGYVEGADGKLLPKKNLTRGEAAKLLIAVFDGETEKPDDLVNAATPIITVQPQSATVTAGVTHMLTVTAAVADGGVLSYQWYGNAAASTAGGTAISDATGAAYGAPVNTPGIFYYYVVVTNTNNNVNGAKTAKATSGVVTLTVSAVPVTHTLAYDVGSGINPPTGGNYSHGAKVIVGAAPTPPANKTFLEWNTAQNGSGSGYQPNNTFAISADTILYAIYLNGTGASGAPIEISTAAQLAAIPRLGLGRHYKLLNDIDLSAYGNWTSIGNESSPFTGTFDGGGHTITGLTINTSGIEYAEAGLFGSIGAGGVAENVTLAGVNIGSYYAGGIASNNLGTVRNCAVYGTVNGTFFSGGVVGYNGGGMVENCYAACDVTISESNAGGVVGGNHGGTVRNCYATGNVAGESLVGGVAGSNSNNGKVENCAALNGSVTATATNSNAGRVAGGGVDSGLSNNYANSAMTVTVGGSAKSTLDEGLNNWDGQGVAASDFTAEAWWKQASPNGPDWTSVWGGAAAGDAKPWTWGGDIGDGSYTLPVLYWQATAPALPAHLDPAYLPAPVITLSGQNISWNAVSGATGYDVYADSTKVVSNISATSLTLSQLAGWIGSTPTSDVSVTVVAAAAQPTNDSPVSNSVTVGVFTDDWVIEIPTVSGNQITADCSSAALGASFRNVLVYLRTRTATVSSSSVSGNAITIDFTGYLDDGNDLAITITASAEGYFDKTFTSLFVCHAPNPWFSRE